MDIKVVNKKMYRGNGIYIGRGSIFGNKFVIGKDGSREDVIEKYLEWLREEYRNGGKVKSELLELVERYKMGEELVLVCWCKPLGCHGDILKMVIEKLSK